MDFPTLTSILLKVTKFGKIFSYTISYFIFYLFSKPILFKFDFGLLVKHELYTSKDFWKIKIIACTEDQEDLEVENLLGIVWTFQHQHIYLLKWLWC